MKLSTTVNCLQSANCLPQGSSHALVLKTQQTLAEGYAQLVTSASSAIDELLDLQAALVEQHTAAKESAQTHINSSSSGKRKRQGDNTCEAHSESFKKWQRVDEAYQKIVPFRDASIDRWHRKTMLISGTSYQ